MVGMGKGISNDQLPFCVKDKAEVSKAAACGGGWDGSSGGKSPALQKICWRAFWMMASAPGFQVLSWNSHLHLLSLWIKLFVFLPYNRMNHEAPCVCVHAGTHAYLTLLLWASHRLYKRYPALEGLLLYSSTAHHCWSALSDFHQWQKEDGAQHSKSSVGPITSALIGPVWLTLPVK